jgi:hypothetical protein
VPAIIPPKPIVDADEKDAAEQANEIMQHAGQMVRAYRELMGKSTAPDQKTLDDYMRWSNVVLRVASMLLPYQRPTYRSIEVRTDKGIEERQTRYIGDPAERLAQIVVGAILATPEAGNSAEHAVQTADLHRTEPATEPANEPVDNGDGVIS